MMRWRPLLSVAAAAAAASVAHSIHHASAAAAASSRRLLFVRLPGARGLGATTGAAGAPPESKKVKQRRPRGPESADVGAAAEDEPQPYFPPGLSTVGRMRMLRAQARASEGEGLGDEQQQQPQPQLQPQPSGHEAVVMAWLRDLVIGLKLCPWAAPALNAGAIRVRIHPDDDLEALTQTMLEEAAALAAMPKVGGTNATTLIGVPNALADFDAFLDYAAVVDGLIDECGLRGKVQLASFHPDYMVSHSVTQLVRRSGSRF
jgi:hypothetical protein